MLVPPAFFILADRSSVNNGNDNVRDDIVIYNFEEALQLLVKEEVKMSVEALMLSHTLLRINEVPLLMKEEVSAVYMKALMLLWTIDEREERTSVRGGTDVLVDNRCERETRKSQCP